MKIDSVDKELTYLSLWV